jgi:hypothetical protein
METTVATFSSLVMFFVRASRSRRSLSEPSPLNHIDDDAVCQQCGGPRRTSNHPFRSLEWTSHALGGERGTPLPPKVDPTKRTLGRARHQKQSRRSRRAAICLLLEPQLGEQKISAATASGVRKKTQLRSSSLVTPHYDNDGVTDDEDHHHHDHTIHQQQQQQQQQHHDRHEQKVIANGVVVAVIRYWSLLARSHFRRRQRQSLRCDWCGRSDSGSFSPSPPYYTSVVSAIPNTILPVIHTPRFRSGGPRFF